MNTSKGRGSKKAVPGAGIDRAKAPRKFSRNSRKQGNRKRSSGIKDNKAPMQRAATAGSVKYHNGKTGLYLCGFTLSHKHR